MKGRTVLKPNILFLMSDQHNANCLGAAGHPNVKTPNLDNLAEDGILFTSAFTNNPICSPSRISFMTGQYPHTHGYLGNNNFETEDSGAATLGTQLRRNRYQTALIGKAHMIRRWDEEAFEHIRYCDLCDADRDNPLSNHYFRYLVDNDLADQYEEGTLPPDHPHTRLGYATAGLPYEHSLERWTGDRTLEFLENRDTQRPFFLHMSFQRPHPNYMPAAEHVGMYESRDIVLPDSASDWYENRFQSKPDFIRQMAERRAKNPDEFKKIVAHYLTLITVIDCEIGRVVDWLRTHDQYNNTIIVYSSDHGDFAGEHGMYRKNIGIYESIHRIPFILKPPGGLKGKICSEIIESIDLYPTLCDLSDVSFPDTVEGRSLLPVVEGKEQGRELSLCEWDFPGIQRRVNAVRTKRFRLVYYSHELGGELYDRRNDPGEVRNVWQEPSYRDVRLKLIELLLDRVKSYSLKSSMDTDAKKDDGDRCKPVHLIHKKCRKWSQVKDLLTSNQGAGSPQAKDHTPGYSRSRSREP